LKSSRDAVLLQREKEANEKRNTKDSGWISASEIATYEFCPLKWYMQRKGYLENVETAETGKGKEEHTREGERIERLETAKGIGTSLRSSCSSR